MNRLALSGTSTHAPTPLGRVDEMLDAHAMGARLHAAIGAGGGGRCHVLDAKYEPGVRCTVLYRAGDLLVRGDLIDEETGSVDAFRPIVAPGVRLSRFPADPDLPRLADAAWTSCGTARPSGRRWRSRYWGHRTRRRAGHSASS
jgi:hypothetical protein